MRQHGGLPGPGPGPRCVCGLQKPSPHRCRHNRRHLLQRRQPGRRHRLLRLGLLLLLAQLLRRQHQACLPLHQLLLLLLLRQEHRVRMLQPCKHVGGQPGLRGCSGTGTIRPAAARDA